MAAETEETSEQEYAAPDRRGTANRQASIVAISSGKGGVGKTHITTNLAIALAEAGFRVCVFDADVGLANINILIGVQPRHTVEDILLDEAGVDEVLIEGPAGIKILPAASGIEKLGNAPQAERSHVVGALHQLEKQFDYLLIDTSAGISNSVLDFVQSSDETTIIITPEPTSMTDAFTLIKTLKRRGYPGGISVIVNMAPPGDDGQRLFNRLDTACAKYLNLHLDYLGNIPLDRAVTSAVVQQTPLLLLKPDSPASRSIRTIADRFAKSIQPTDGQGGFAAYWRGVADVDAAELDPPGDTVTTQPVIVTAPAPMRKSGAETGGPGIRETADDLCRALMTDELTELEARETIARIAGVFSSRFKKSPAELKEQIYSALEDENSLTEQQYRELLQTLEAIFSKRFEQPYRDPQDFLAATLQSDRRLPTDALLAMLRQISGRLLDHPQVTPRDLQEHLAKIISHERFAADSFGTLLSYMRDAHKARFGEALPERNMALVADLESLMEEMTKRRNELERRMTEVCLVLDNHAALEDDIAARLNQEKNIE